MNCAPEPVLNQPSMSTAMFTAPTLFQIETVQLPLAHVTGTITRLGSTACAGTLRFDAFGRTPPPVKAVSTVGTVGAMAVRLNATAADSGSGHQAAHAAHRERECRGRRRWALGVPMLQRLVAMPGPGARVSQMRSGAVDVYRSDEVAGAT